MRDVIGCRAPGRWAGASSIGGRRQEINILDFSHGTWYPKYHGPMCLLHGSKARSSAGTKRRRSSVRPADVNLSAHSCSCTSPDERSQASCFRDLSLPTCPNGRLPEKSEMICLSSVRRTIVAQVPKPNPTPAPVYPSLLCSSLLFPSPSLVQQERENVDHNLHTCAFENKKGQSRASGATGRDRFSCKC